MMLKEWLAETPVEISSKYVGEKDKMYVFRVTLKFPEREYSFKYRKGLAHVGYPSGGKWRQLSYREYLQYQNKKKYGELGFSVIKPIPPQLDEVFECLLSDTQSYLDNPSFEDFANSLGYDSDSIQHKKIFKKTRKQTNALKKLLGWSKFNLFASCNVD